MKSEKGKQIKVMSGFPFVPDLTPCLHVSLPTVVGGFSPLRQKLFLEPPNSHYLSKIKLLKISMLSAKKNNNRKLYSAECADSSNVSVIIHV